MTDGGGFGYLLKDRVLDVDDFLDAARRVADGGSALDPQVVAGDRLDVYASDFAGTHAKHAKKATASEHGSRCAEPDSSGSGG